MQSPVLYPTQLKQQVPHVTWATYRVASAKDVVHKGQEVWVKVVSTIGKLSLSLRDVDQNTGKDLLPSQSANPSGSNPGPAGGQGLRGLSGITVKDDDKGNMPRRRPGKRLTSPERWEITQLIKSGVLDVTEYPTFDEEEGVGPGGFLQVLPGTSMFASNAYLLILHMWYDCCCYVCLHGQY